MLFTDKLKDKLGEHFDLIKELLKDKDIYLMEPKDYLPKDKINELRNEIATLKESKETMNTDLEASKLKVTELEKATDDGKKTTDDKFADLGKQIEELVNQGAEKDKALERSDLLSLLNNDLTLAKVNPKYKKQVLAEFDLSTMKKDKSGKIEGNVDRIKSVVENFPLFFGEEKFVGDPLSTGDSINISQDEVEYQKLMAKETLNPLELSKAVGLAENIKLKQKE